MHTAQYFHFRGQQLIPVPGEQQRTGRLNQPAPLNSPPTVSAGRFGSIPAIKASSSVA
jgi:hypothetical protein